MLSFLLLSACCLMARGPDCDSVYTQGGLRLELEVHPDGDASQVVPVLERRLEGLEVQCARVTGQGQRVVVDIPSPSAGLEEVALLGRPGVISLRPELEPERAAEVEAALARGVALPEGVLALVEPARGSEPERRYLVEGGLVDPQLVEVEQFGGQSHPRVYGHLGPEDGERFAELTGGMVDRRLVIDLDGEVLMAPVVRERIGGHRFTIDMGQVDEDPLARAQELTIVLRAGSLPAPVELVSETTYRH